LKGFCREATIKKFHFRTRMELRLVPNRAALKTPFTQYRKIP
jgi:hypothetical protein